MIRVLVIGLVVLSVRSFAAPVEPAPAGNLVLWRAPRAMTASDWVWGPGGEQRAPIPPFTFVKENLGGTNPEGGCSRRARRLVGGQIGAEVHTDVFASRLLYAVGYPTEPTYFVAEAPSTESLASAGPKRSSEKTAGFATPGSNCTIAALRMQTSTNGRGWRTCSWVPTN